MNKGRAMIVNAIVQNLSALQVMGHLTITQRQALERLIDESVAAVDVHKERESEFIITTPLCKCGHEQNKHDQFGCFDIVRGCPCLGYADNDDTNKKEGEPR